MNLTVESVAAFDKVVAQMNRLLTDVETLAKKAPDGPISKFKLGVINEQLRAANLFVQPPYKPIGGFDEFDVVSLPSNSDVVLVVSQYLTCLERWRSDNVRRVNTGLSKYWVWNLSGVNLKTHAPSGTVDVEDDHF